MSRGAIHGVLVTYNRPEDLRIMLEQLGAQSRRLDSLVIVDNAPSGTSRDVVAQHGSVADHVEYLESPENLGPAGGLKLGASSVLRRASDEDWMVFLDDDDPPRSPEALAELERFALEMRRRDPMLGGVGLVGAKIDARTGIGRRPADTALTGSLLVDYVGGNQLPFLAVDAVRAAGPPREELFFGFDDLELGMRLNSAGRRLYASGELWLAERAARGRLHRSQSPARRLEAPYWRDYYAVRNLIWILRSNGAHRAAAHVVLRRVVAKPLANLPVRPRTALAHLRVGGRAAVDGYTGRLGRRVDPEG